MLKDALARCLQGAALIGGRAVVVKAIDENALAYWKRRGFLSSKDDPFTLYRSIDAIAASLREAVKPHTQGGHGSDDQLARVLDSLSERSVV